VPGALALIRKLTFGFADEPTGALDWANGERVFEFLRDAVHDRRTTVLVVAHDARARPFANREFIQVEDRLRERGGNE
jgi:ABC-type lipoprotein export system ATPase subunit